MSTNKTTDTDIGPATIEALEGMHSFSNNTAGMSTDRTPVQLDGATLAKLQDIPKLPIVAHSWPADACIMAQPNNRHHLQELARITGSVPVAWWYTDSDMELALSVAQASPCVSLCVNYPMWQTYTPYNRDPESWLGTQEEYDRAKQYIERVKKLGHTVGAVAIDFERYLTWSALVDARAMVCYNLFTVAWPYAEFIWYRNADWDPAKQWPCKNRTVAHYRPYNALYTERVTQLARQEFPDEQSWGAWTTLGSGYSEDARSWAWKLGESRWHDHRLGYNYGIDPMWRFVLIYPNVTRPACLPDSVDALKSFVNGYLDGRARRPK